MKKHLIIISILVIFAALFVGCNGKTYELPRDTFCVSMFTSKEIVLKLEDKEFIIDLLNGAEWENGSIECGFEYAFYTQKQEIRYYSVTGTFYDVTYKKNMTVSEEQRSAVNDILCVKTNTYVAKPVNLEGWITVMTDEEMPLASVIWFDPTSHTFMSSNGALSSQSGLQGTFEVDNNTVICRSYSSKDSVQEGNILFVLTREGDSLITQEGKKVYRAASSEELDKLMATEQSEASDTIW